MSFLRATPRGTSGGSSDEYYNSTTQAKALLTGACYGGKTV